MISINDLTVSFGGFTLLDSINFHISDGEHIALVGKNGAGKSTILKLIMGVESPTSGKILKPQDLTIGYLPQIMEYSKERSVIDEAMTAFADMFAMQDRMEQINVELATRTDYESAGYHKLIEELNDINDRLAFAQSDSPRLQAEKTLVGLGFKKEELDRKRGTFSQGWNMRVELAKVLLKRPKVIMLDEPTNHLDIESIQWLEDFLARNGKAVVLVSHDRAFINNVTNRTIEITCGTIHDYKVKYDEYVVLRRERREQQLRAYENQQKEIADITDFIERFRYKPTKAIQVQSRIKQLEKMVPVVIDEEDRSTLRLKFRPAQRSGNYPVICEGVGKTYNRPIFQDATLTIHRGEKVAFVGKNGEGKTTLVKCIMGEIPFDGKLTIGHNVEIGYFAQNQAQLLDENLTVFETIDRVAVGDIRLKIRDILGAFMFGGEASDKKVKVLSGGERSRLAMIKLLLESVNLLILDEPTNHLDMRSKDVLKEAIREFDGTVIIVSHDREFLDGLVTKVYEFGGGKVKEHLGGIYDFLQKKGVDDIAPLLSSQPKVKVVTPTSSTSAEELSGAASYAARKEQAKQQRKLQKRVEECEKRVAQIEAELKELEEWMATPSGAANPALFEQYGQLKNKLVEAESEWEEAMMALEE